MSLRRGGFSIATILTLAVGIAASIAVLDLVAGVSGPLPCPAPLSCESAAQIDHLPPATPDRLLPAQAVASGFRTLAHVAVALTLILVGLVGLNIVTTALTRTSAARADTAVRVALGAEPLRLLFRFTREALSIATAALLVGAALGIAARGLLRGSWPAGKAPWTTTGSVLFAVIAIAGVLVTVLFVTLCWPAALAWRRNLRAHLGTADRATPGPVDALVKDSLAVLQSAAALTLLFAAGLLVFAFADLRDASGRTSSSDLPERTLLFEVQVAKGVGAEAAAAARARLYEELLDRIRSLPGVVDTSLASEGAWLGLGVTERVTSFCLECWVGLAPKQQTRGPVRIHAVGPGYFRTVGQRVLRGRPIGMPDQTSGVATAVINQALAYRFFPNGDPLGKEVRIGDLEGPWFRIVGIVEDLRAEGLASGSEPEPELYLPILQAPPAAATVLATAEVSAEEIRDDVQGAVAEVVGPAAGRARMTLAESRAAYRAPLAWFGGVFAALAAAALVCACVGLYGLMSAQVRLRAWEIWIRMAVGANERRIVRMVMGKTLRLVALGVVIGAIPLSGLARMLQLRFAGVDPWDPLLFAATAALLAAVGLVASHGPAREAVGRG